MLKDAHVNTVRLHAMPHPEFYLELADEMGMIVVGETGLWGSNCNLSYDAPELWKLSENQIDGMLRRDRNHPSIVGWSVMNECLIAIKLRTSDPAYFHTMSDKFAGLLARVSALDPTRPYVVCEDPHHVEGSAATIIHYVGPEADRAAEAAGRPWAITEDSQAWFSLPPFAAQWAGDRAYENFAGRMEGVGIEVYELLTQRHVPSSAFYISPYSVTWYGLKHMPLGHPQTERPQTMEDGVLFTAPYQEGKPGMQPERIAPYSMTLNPGYDPSFPLYQPTPFFEALQAAFAPGGPLPCQWDQRRTPLKPWDAITPLATIPQVAFLGDLAGTLGQSLMASGIPLVNAVAGNTDEPILLVDVGSLPADQVEAARKSLAGHKGAVLLWVSDRGAENTLKRLAPEEVSLTDFATTALLPDRKTHLGHAFSPSSLYFSEASSGRTILRYGLAGPLVERGTVILRGNKTDWPSWRSQTESTRNQILARSENEHRPSGAALVELQVGPTRWLVSSMETAAPTPQHREIFRTLFRQLGVQLADPRPLASPILSGDGVLQQAMVLGPFTAASYEAAFANDFLGGESAAKAEPGTKIGDHEWKILKSDAEGIFPLNSLSTDPQAMNAAAYLSFWVFSPRSDNVLEGNPRGAKLDLTVASDDGLKIWYNNQPILDMPAARAISYPPFQLNRLSLNRGWNHFLVKVANTHGDWKFRARLQCSDPELAPLLQAALFPEISKK
jgi:beta-galactosidase